MKNFFLNFFIFSSFAIIFATPTDNPAFPKIVKKGFIFSPGNGIYLGIGYEGNFVDDRNLLQKNSFDKKVNSFKEYINSGILSITILQRLDISAIIGKGYFKGNWQIEEISNAYTNIEFETNTDFTYGFSSKIIFFEWGDVCFSLGGRYFYADPKLSHIKKENDIYTFENEKIDYKEWQVDLGLSYTIDFITPYISGTYSKAKAKITSPDVFITSNWDEYATFKSKDNFGVALGLTLSNADYFLLNVETRLIDETAYTVSGIFKF